MVTDERACFGSAGAVDADRPYRVIVENMGDAAATLDEHGSILYTNPRFAEVLRADRASLTGCDVADYLAADQRPTLAGLFAGRSTETRRAELVLAGDDGQDVPYLVAVTDLDLGERDTVVRCLVLTDLSMQKMVQRQIAEDAARTERQSVAHEVNDTIVQGLVAAEMALDLGQVDYARSLVARTSAHARHWIGELAGVEQLQPGMAQRSGPARSDPEAP